MLVGENKLLDHLNCILIVRIDSSFVVEKERKFVGCSMCKNSVEIFPVVLSQQFSYAEGCLLSVLECFCPHAINIAEILLCPLNVPIVNKHCSSQSNKQRLFGNVT